MMIQHAQSTKVKQAAHESFNFYGADNAGQHNDIKSQYRTSVPYDKKTKIVEVIDFGGETTYNMPTEGQIFSYDEVKVQSAAKEVKPKNNLQRKDSDTMLNKLMENILKNPALKN